MSIRIVLLGVLLFIILGVNSQCMAQGKAGFSEAVFDVQTIQDLFKRGSSDSIRFYTVLDGSSVYIMAISTENGKDETGGFFTRKPYVLSKGMNNSGIIEDKVSESNARAMCEANDNSSNQYLITNFSKKDVEALIKVPKCNALKITPTTSNSETTMDIQAAEFNSGRVAPLGSKLIDPDPCPPVCGAPGNYVYSL